MLREIEKTRQIAGEPTRRWFSDTSMDLIVWVEQESAVGFQLTYDKPHAEKAVTWTLEPPYLHHTGVDDGEYQAGRFKSTPILVPEGNWDAWHVCGKFLGCSELLPDALRELVCRTLVNATGNMTV